MSMSFLKNLFNKGESFTPTPTITIPGLEPIVVQAIENLYPDIADQNKAFEYFLEYAKKHKKSTLTQLAMLAYSEGKVEHLPHPGHWDDGRFNIEEISPIFSYKMKNAEEWVKSITKNRT
jgi:hypothetical protein